MCGVRYGLHAMSEEHFGIAVAELQRAGCVTFVPERGGPREIVGEDKRLLFDTDDEAVTKIDRVLGDRQLQRELFERSHERRDLFSTDRFVDQLRQVVASFEREQGFG